MPAARPAAARGALGRGLAANLLSPHPWLFWITLGGPLLAAAAHQSLTFAGVFLVTFYALLVGTKVILALLTARWGRGLTDRGYRLACRALGVALALFAARLGWDGLSRLAGL